MSSVLLVAFFSVPLLAGESGEDSNSYRMGEILISPLVHLYQEKINPKTISRCPFEVSCSNYLLMSIKNEGGIKGLALFLDRYFIRENHDIHKHYKARFVDNKLKYIDEIPEGYISYLYPE